MILVALAIAMICSAAVVAAEPIISEQTDYYLVSSISTQGLVDEMRQKGKYGYWGYADWRVTSTDNCQVSLHVTYTLPRHINPAVLPKHMLGKWNSMIAALVAHEKQHAQHGRFAAQQIERDNCSWSYAIIAKWMLQDILFDLVSDHGGKQGVQLN